MYTRAYPPRNAPLPQNYSGVALLGREAAEDEENRVAEAPASAAAGSNAVTESPKAERTTPGDSPAIQEENRTAPPKKQAETTENEAPANHGEDESCAAGTEECRGAGAALPPPAVDTADMLLVTLAALLSQNGQADGELIMVLLLLLLGA